MKFLCSKGIGTGAKHLLTNPEKLRQGLIAHWKDNVENKITDTAAIPLTNSLKTLVETAPFSIFGPMGIEEVLTDLEGATYYVSTFGGGLPPRPASATPPSVPLAHESRYVMQLFAVYAERGGGGVDLATLDKESRDHRHFDVCRQQFYCAESLKEFARDATRPGTFEGLQQDVLSAIIRLRDRDGSRDSPNCLSEDKCSRILKFAFDLIRTFALALAGFRVRRRPIFICALPPRVSRRSPA